MKGVDEEMTGMDPANVALAGLMSFFCIACPLVMHICTFHPLLFWLPVIAGIVVMVVIVTTGGSGEKVKVGLSMANKWTDSTAVLILALPVGIASQPVLVYLLWRGLGLWAVLAMYAGAYAAWEFVYLDTPPADTAAFIEFKDKALESRWAKKRIPICILYESYCEGKLVFKKDLLETLEFHRHEFIDWRPTFTILRFLVVQAFPQVSTSFKSLVATKREIADHYDRGNDFFRAFMGPSMVYTCGIFHGDTGKGLERSQTLEEAQFNKMATVCRKILVEPGDSFLDIGCGWGTLSRHAAKYWGAKATGITLSKEGKKWCEMKNKLEKVEDKVDIVFGDYRELPQKGVGKFKRIASIEMAEHVGLENFQQYLSIVSELLDDEGVFLMQVSGLRKGSNWEDTAWGLFMSKYIFPGADASTPCNWYVLELEKAGFEVQSVETIGRHYSHTMRTWYTNWVSNQEAMKAKYPAFLCNLWHIFLGWSVVASGYGSATCYQFVAHKNTYTFPRDAFISADGIKDTPFNMPKDKKDAFPE